MKRSDLYIDLSLMRLYSISWGTSEVKELNRNSLTHMVSFCTLDYRPNTMEPIFFDTD